MRACERYEKPEPGTSGKPLGANPIRRVRVLGLAGLLAMSAACSDLATPDRPEAVEAVHAQQIASCSVSGDGGGDCPVHATIEPFLHHSSLNEPIYTGPITVTFDAPVTQVQISGQGAVWCLGDLGTLVGYDADGAEVERAPLSLIDPSDCAEDDISFGGAATLTTTAPLSKIVILPPNPFQFQFTSDGTVLDGNTTADYTLGFTPASEPVQSDLIARTIHWNGRGDGVDFTYEVAGQDLAHDTTVGLFWASGPTQGDILGQAFSQAADRTVGTHAVHASAGQIAPAPPDATHLLNVVGRDDTVVTVAAGGPSSRQAVSLAAEDPSNDQVALRLPHITLANTTDLHITAAPAMPVITISLRNVPARFVPALSVQWHTEITSGPGDFPHQIARFSATPIDATVTGSDQYQPDFQTQVVGGKLTFTADYSVAGVALQASSKNLRILGTQPDAAVIEAYVGTKPAPGTFPVAGGFTYGEVLLRIMQKETKGLQFRPQGAPVFNLQDDGGAGLFQITPPSTADVWNWRANVDGGASTLNSKFGNGPNQANSWIDERAVAQAAEQVRKQLSLPRNTPVQVVPAPWPHDVMVLREGVQRNNGGRAFQAAGRAVTVNGTTVIQVTWERTGNGYHERVLGPLTP